jgi:arginase family enzyme
MSRLRARCPDCRTLTAVALGPEYECHACGRVFGAGLVRVPRAWGAGGDAMAEAAHLSLPYPEAEVVEEPTLTEQTLALAAVLPERPLVVGGCCCAHVGAVKGLAARNGPLAVVWFDAHGDLNTPETSPSGNPWGMPFRVLIDSGTVAPENAALVGARNLDPPEAEFIAATGVRTGPAGIDAALDGVESVYVAFDVDVLDPGEDADSFMPEPGGLRLVEAEAMLARIAARRRIAGAGFTAFKGSDRSAAALARLAAALGF